LLPPVSSAAFVALAAGATVATIIDIRSRRIPNTLTAAMAGVGVGLAVTGMSSVSVAASVGGLVVGLMLMMPGHVMGATGAGDVKLMGGVGAILGVKLVVTAFLFTAIAGGVLAVAVALRRRRLGATLAGTGRLIAAPTELRGELRKSSPVSRFAYGPAIAIGSVIAAIVG
jgi:prepilin peptidase CpaA